MTHREGTAISGCHREKEGNEVSGLKTPTSLGRLVAPNCGCFSLSYIQTLTWRGHSFPGREHQEEVARSRQTKCYLPAHCCFRRGPELVGYEVTSGIRSRHNTTETEKEMAERGTVTEADVAVAAQAHLFHLTLMP